MLDSNVSGERTYESEIIQDKADETALAPANDWYLEIQAILSKDDDP